jgi:hypothetical protein
MVGEKRRRQDGNARSTRYDGVRVTVKQLKERNSQHNINRVVASIPTLGEETLLIQDRHRVRQEEGHVEESEEAGEPHGG